MKVDKFLMHVVQQVLRQGEKMFGKANGQPKNPEKTLSGQEPGVGPTPHPFLNKQQFDGVPPETSATVHSNPEGIQNFSHELTLQQQKKNAAEATFNPTPTPGAGA